MTHPDTPIALTDRGQRLLQKIETTAALTRIRRLLDAPGLTDQEACANISDILTGIGLPPATYNGEPLQVDEDDDPNLFQDTASDATDSEDDD